MRSILRARPAQLLKTTPKVATRIPVVSAKKASTAQRSTRVQAGRGLSSSTTTPPPLEADPPVETAPETSPADPPAAENPDEPEKPKKSTKKSVKADVEALSSPQLPQDLDVIWTPEEDTQEPNAARPTSLPPPEIFEEALNNLHVALHPQTQHRATYSTNQGPLVEPTLALYCPIEGGDYVLDETVRELARQTHADVVVLDAAQLAAGEWGHFGKAATVLDLPRNPLHFSSVSLARAETQAVQDEDEPDMVAPVTAQMAIVHPAKRMISASSVRALAQVSREKVFFDEVVNLPPKSAGAFEHTGKPRLIYVRDFPTLASSSPSWYPHLLAAVRSRRAGPLARPASPVDLPTVIIFGMTPGLTSPPIQSSPSSTPGGLAWLLRKGISPNSIDKSPGKADWDENEAADKARERRLRDCLKKWEKGDVALYDEMPPLLPADGGEGSMGQRQEIVVTGSMFVIPSFGGGGNPFTRPRPETSDSSARFFRTSILVPGTRSVVQERESRVARRRELNELTIRMAVGAIGGVLEKSNTASTATAAPETEQVADTSEVVEDSSAQGSSVEATSEVTTKTLEPTPATPTEANPSTAVTDITIPTITPPTPEEKMWENWGKRVEVWSTVRRIADRAVGSVVASMPSQSLSLEATAITWPAVHRAWIAQKSSQELKVAWMQDSATKVAHEEGVEEEDTVDADELIESIKEDQDLEAHEKRLLHCIVDAESMPTSFDHVHLPAHTIDSVRTIVSLPLLHPAAFQQGILKQHGMTGCLLFGPPGTGKTLVVKALAKEAGSRMLAISPSDVMDMYVGEGEKLVKAVFSLARRLSPCVVFIDEIDALFGARMSGGSSGSAMVHRGVITEFMQEMDGLKSSKEDNIIVIGATNRPFDLDDAVLRRLPRRLLVDLPGEKEREAILRILLRDEILASDLDLKALAKQTASFSGSDLKHLCVSAALDSVKEHVVVPWKFARSPKPTEEGTVTAPPTDSDAVVSTTDSSTTATEDEAPTEDAAPVVSNLPVVVPTPETTHSRALGLHNFAQALKEITPSSSESLGSLSDLRKWNDEFGEGRKEKTKQVWGKGTFGFNLKDPKVAQEAGRVVANPDK